MARTWARSRVLAESRAGVGQRSFSHSIPALARIEQFTPNLRLGRLVRLSGLLRLTWHSCSLLRSYASHTKFLAGLHKERQVTFFWWEGEKAIRALRERSRRKAFITHPFH